MFVKILSVTARKHKNELSLSIKETVSANLNALWIFQQVTTHITRKHASVFRRDAQRREGGNERRRCCRSSETQFRGSVDVGSLSVSCITRVLSYHCLWERRRRTALSCLARNLETWPRLRIAGLWKCSFPMVRKSVNLEWTLWRSQSVF